MNSVQEKSFNLLKIFVDICEKWDINYYLVCGSVLGAVKYQGFIPWDDDIDVGLLRPDYQRFLEVAPKELPEGYFLQYYKTEPSFPFAYSKLRDSNTTFIEQSVKKIPMNHGIFLDIFPIDGCPKGYLEKKIFFARQKLYTWMRIAATEDSPKRWVRIRNKIFRFLGYHKRTAKVQYKLEKLYMDYLPDASDLWCNYGNWQRELEHAPKWHYGNGAWATFEGMKVRIPENYDAYLTQKYGEWRQDPPKEQQCTHHHTIFCDAQKPYTHYLEQI